MPQYSLLLFYLHVYGVRYRLFSSQGNCFCLTIAITLLHFAQTNLASTVCLKGGQVDKERTLIRPFGPLVVKVLCQR